MVQLHPDPPIVSGEAVSESERLLAAGAIAQLGERLPCTQEVGSSILPGSTNWVVVRGPGVESERRSAKRLAQRLAPLHLWQSIVL